MQGALCRGAFRVADGTGSPRAAPRPVHSRARLFGDGPAQGQAFPPLILFSAVEVEKGEMLSGDLGRGACFFGGAVQWDTITATNSPYLWPWELVPLVGL